MEISRTPKSLVKELGVSLSRVSDYISERAEPTLRIARAICLVLGIVQLQSSAYKNSDVNYFEIQDLIY